jgi:Fur family transcriptional regulator, ferric uptake regulator
MKPKQELLLELKDKGLRLTPQRERVVAIFYDLPNGQHLGAEDLYAILRKEPELDISLATLYRTLKLLAQHGVLREVDFGEDKKQYELNRYEEAPHHHLICTTCNLTEEFESPMMQQEAEQLALTMGFALCDLQVKLYAQCLPNKVGCPKQASPLV